LVRRQVRQRRQLQALSTTSVGRFEAEGVLAMANPDLPRPWIIAAGPTRIRHDLVDGLAWLYTLERDGFERPLVVAVSGQALKLGNPEAMPVRTREAIATDGRSEAARVAQLDDPTNRVVLGRSGYLPAVPGLVRLARH
jgi:hypothetical protein